MSTSSPGNSHSNSNSYLNIEGRFFTTNDGRSIWLRGVNLSGSSKNPSNPPQPSHISEGFYNYRNVSFVGRPFPIEEADEHFARLKYWGFNFFRFNVPWEAIEHSGPGIYDDEYLDYVIAVLLKARDHGLRCFVDPHQDMWSRFSGGSGAPGWTFEVVGLEPRNFAKCGAAIVHSQYPDPVNYPRMVWNTNVNKLAASTMYILFFGGKTFAPKCVVDGQSIEEYLQSHFLNSFARLVQRIVDNPILKDSVVVGYDTFNEPMGGWIGREDLTKFGEHEVLNEDAPTPFQSMLLGEGIPCFVQHYKMTALGSFRIWNRKIDPKGTRAWSEGSNCIWAEHEVWDKETQKLLKPDYFHRRPETGEIVEFSKDFWRPFVRTVNKVIRSIHQSAILFIEPSPFHVPPSWHPEEGDPVDRVCYSPHWYDGFILVTKTYTKFVNPDLIGFVRKKYAFELFALKFGERAIRKSVVNQLDMLRNEGLELYGEFPCVMGEIGIPFDMNKRDAYRTGNYKPQILSMDMTLNALERNLINFTLWNYCSDNTNEWGDGWNGEDLSIWSRSVVKSGKTTASPLPPISNNPEEEELPRSRSNSRSWLADSYANLRRRRNQDEDEHGPGDIPLQPLKQPTTLEHPIQSPNTFVDSNETLNVGARALEAYCRPYPILTPGEPRAFSFDLEKAVLIFTFRHPNLYSTQSARFGWPSLNEFTSQTTDKTTLKQKLSKLEVELYLPKIHYSDMDQLEMWSSDKSLESISGVDAFESMKNNWRIDLDAQRAFWKCSCASDLIELVDSGNPTAISKDSHNPYEEHTIIIRRIESTSEIQNVGKEVLEKRRRNEGRNTLADGNIVNDEEDVTCCGLCSIM